VATALCSIRGYRFATSAARVYVSGKGWMFSSVSTAKVIHNQVKNNDKIPDVRGNGKDL
jgi:hypothetical protein